MTKKTSIIVVISVVIILISLILSIYIPNKDKIGEEIEDESIVYTVINENDKFGVKNEKDETVIEPQYEKIIIPNEHRAVFVCLNGEEKKILNNENKEIFTNYDDVEPIQLSNLTEEKYERNVLIYKSDDKYGLINMSGKIILDAKYDEIYSLGFKEGEIVVKENNKYGVVDSKGNTVIKNIYDSIESDEYYSQEDGYNKSGYIVCTITDEGYRYGYYDYEGGKVLEDEYNQITRLTDVGNNENIYLIASKNGQFGVFINGTEIVKTQYQSITYNSELKIFIVERTGKFGVMDENGVEVLKTEYTDVQVNGIYIYAQKENEQKVFDAKGNEVNIPFTTIIEKTTNPEYYIRKEDSGYSILKSDFTALFEQKYSYIEYLFDKYFIATNETGKSGIIDDSGNVVVDFIYDVVQLVKEKNIVQAIDFATNTSYIYNNEIKLTVQITNMNIEELEDKIRIYNDTEEYFIDNNGNKIEN